MEASNEETRQTEDFAMALFDTEMKTVTRFVNDGRATEESGHVAWCEQ